MRGGKWLKGMATSTATDPSSCRRERSAARLRRIEQLSRT